MRFVGVGGGWCEASGILSDGLLCHDVEVWQNPLFSKLRTLCHLDLRADAHAYRRRVKTDDETGGNVAIFDAKSGKVEHRTPRPPRLHTHVHTISVASHIVLTSLCFNQTVRRFNQKQIDRWYYLCIESLDAAFGANVVAIASLHLGRRCSGTKTRRLAFRWSA